MSAAMRVEAPLELLSPPDATSWDAFVAAADGASVFHTSGWARLWAAEWRGSQWRAIVMREGEGIAGAIGFLVREGPFGLRIQAMPDGTYGGPLVRSGHPDPARVRRRLLEEYARVVADAGVLASHLTWLEGARSEVPPGVEVIERVTHVAQVPRVFDDALAWLPAPVRSTVRQAEKHGLELRPLAGAEELGACYGLVAQAAARHRARVKPLSLYRRILDELVPAKLARYDVVIHEGRAIALGLHLLYRGVAMNWTLVAEDAARHLRPNHLIHARLTRELGEAGFHQYDYGASPAGAEGLVHFKEQWGAVPRPVLTLRRRKLLHRLLRP